MSSRSSMPASVSGSTSAPRRDRSGTDASWTRACTSRCARSSRGSVARRCLAARPKIALEFHCFKFADPVEHVARVLDLLPRAGYEYQIAYEAGDELVDYTLDRHSASVIGSRYNPHLYALPRERYRKASN